MSLCQLRTRLPDRFELQVRKNGSGEPEVQAFATKTSRGSVPASKQHAYCTEAPIHTGWHRSGQKLLEEAWRIEDMIRQRDLFGAKQLGI